MATLIPTDGVPTYIRPANGQSFTLAELQTMVAGYIEALHVPLIERATDAPLVMFLNEDGKRLRLPVNRFATALMRQWLRPDDFIVGTVVVCTFLEAGEGVDDDGLP